MQTLSTGSEEKDEEACTGMAQAAQAAREQASKRKGDKRRFDKANAHGLVRARLHGKRVP